MHDLVGSVVTLCIDQVILFTGLVGGARARLLSAGPLLMLVQSLCCRSSLFLFAVADVLFVIESIRSPRRSCC